MKKIYFLFIYLILIHFTNAQSKFVIQKQKDKKERQYESIKGDPLGLRVYRLKNGLQVFLFPNKKQPRISTFIQVQAGAKNDPKENSGLAHYLEHLLFKGTDKIGTSNWEKEAPLLSKIEELYESHKKEVDPTKKKEIYKKIDELSKEASKYVIAKEFDKMMSEIGATNINAFTNFDKTVYVSNIPSNELERWLMLESERFSKFVPRLFSNELETVYEEYNARHYNFNSNAREALFPSHPYGKSIIGEPIDLRNPSIKEIKKFFNTYYVANNMQMILIGDLDYEITIEKIEKYFKKIPHRDLPKIKFEKEKSIISPIFRKSYGTPLLEKTYRIENEKDNILKNHLIYKLLTDSTKGFLSKLSQERKLHKTSSYYHVFDKYLLHSLYARPKDGQTLEEVENLLNNEIEKIKKGDFDFENLKKRLSYEINESLLKYKENKDILASQINEVNIKSIKDWLEFLETNSKLEKLRKKDLINFTKHFYKNNYVVFHTREDLLKLDHITPSELYLDKVFTSSNFYKKFKQLKPSLTLPEIIDYTSEIQKDKIKSYPLEYVLNKENEDFTLAFIYDISQYTHLPLMNYAFEYIFSFSKKGQELNKKLADINVKTSYDLQYLGDKSYLSLEGKEKDLKEALVIVKEFINTLKPNEQEYQEYLKFLNKNLRENRINNLFFLFFQKSRFNNDLDKKIFKASKNLDKKSSKDFISLFKKMINSSFHQIYYYGKNIKELKENLIKFYQNVSPVNSNLERKEIPEPATNSAFYIFDFKDSTNFYLHFIKRISQIDSIEKKMFFDILGSYINKILFDEIREKASLSYNFRASIDGLAKMNPYAYLNLNVNEIDPEKFIQVFKTFIMIMEKLPMDKEKFELVKQENLKNLSSNKIERKNIFWQYEFQKKLLGKEVNTTREEFKILENFSFEEFQNFYKKYIINKPYNVEIFGNKTNIDFKSLDLKSQAIELKEEELMN